jgi:NitT/TauT family transport system substrate-binding protein
MKLFQAIALTVLLLAGPALPARSGELKRVAFIPQWIPQAQFAGYFVALEEGLYERYGIDADILKGGPTQPASELLEQGRALFGTMFLSTAIQKRAEGVSFLNIGQIVQRSSLMLVAKKSSGIHSPQDMDGRKIGLWGAEFQVQPRAFFQKYGLKVTVVPQSTTINLFLRGGVDVASAMWYNEYHLLLNAGLDPDELTPFFFFEHGMNFPEDGIYCLEETYKRDPGLCRGFVRASLEGWRRAFEDPEKALDVVMRHARAANTGTNRVHQRWMLARMKDIILLPGEESPSGTLKEKDYGSVAAALKGYGLVDDPPTFSDFFADCAHD